MLDSPKFDSATPFPIAAYEPLHSRSRFVWLRVDYTHLVEETKGPIARKRRPMCVLGLQHTLQGSESSAMLEKDSDGEKCHHPDSNTDIGPARLEVLVVHTAVLRS